jgi:hypothetical protein
MGLIKNILSIDFDFFVPEDPMWDIGHRENEFFLNKIWFMRPQLLNQMKVSEDLDGFWERLPFEFRTDELFVSESHAEAYNLLLPPCNVILFDAHHDAYWKHFKEERKTKAVSCGTWLSHAIEERIVLRILWVVPDWYHKFNDKPPIDTIPEYFKHNFETVSLSRLPNRLKNIGVHEIDAAHLCRSGCWVAPWLDDKFIDFAHSGPFSEVTEICKYHPLSKRWTDKEYAALKVHRKQFEEYRDKAMKEMERKRKEREDKDATRSSEE